MSKMNLGRFVVTDSLMRESDVMIQVQHGMAVLNVHQDLMRMHHEFLAVGDMFDPVSDCELPPLYDANVTKIKDGSDVYYRVKFNRRKVQQ